MNKKLVKLTESDLRGLVKRSVNRILREFGSDGPDFENMNFDSASLPDREYKELDPENDLNFLNDYEFLPSMRRGRHVQSANDFDELPESRRRSGRMIRENDDFNYDAYYRSLKGFLNNPIDINNGDYNPSDEEIMSAMDDLNLDDLDLDLPESKKRMGRIIRESINKVLNESNDDWQDAYMDDRGNKIQSRGHGPNKKFRTIKGQEPKKQTKQSKKYPSDDWEEAYMDDKGNRIQSKGHGPNKKFRTIRKG